MKNHGTSTIHFPFKSWPKCHCNYTAYISNNQAGITVLDPEGDIVLIASTNITSHYTLRPGQTWIKDWSENEGIFQALLDANIVEDTGIDYPTGFCLASLVTIIDPAYSLTEIQE